MSTTPVQSRSNQTLGVTELEAMKVGASEGKDGTQLGVKGMSLEVEGTSLGVEGTSLGVEGVKEEEVGSLLRSMSTAIQEKTKFDFTKGPSS